LNEEEIEIVVKKLKQAYDLTQKKKSLTVMLGFPYTIKLF
jgi:hypothetical protein